MKLTQLLLASAITLSSAMAYSENWVLVDQTENKYMKIYIDVDSIKYHRFSNQAGGYITAWTKWDFYTTQKASNGKLFRQVNFFDYYDCQNKRSNTYQSILYTSQGNYIDSEKRHISTSSSDSWNREIPETIGGIVLKTACSYAHQP